MQYVPGDKVLMLIRSGIRAILARQVQKRSRAVAYSRARYHALRAAGLCVRCKSTAIPGMTLCENCRLYNNQRRSGAATAPRSPYRDGRRQ